MKSLLELVTHEHSGTQRLNHGCRGAFVHSQEVYGVASLLTLGRPGFSPLSFT